MTFQRSDFWPPIQGGAEIVRGYVAPLSVVLEVLGERLATPLTDHPDVLDAEDTSDLFGFLEERAQEAALPSPERVVSGRQLPRDQRQLLADTSQGGCLVIWSEEAFEAWRPTMPLPGFIGPLQLEVSYPRFVATGASVLLWILAAIAMAALLLDKQLC